MEWRGGMIPHIGISKEDSTKSQPIINNPVSLRENSTQWNQYRGPNRDGHIPAQGVAFELGRKTKASMEDSYRCGPLIGLNCGTNRVSHSNKVETGKHYLHATFLTERKMEISTGNQMG
jgi:hypothetical protein